MSVMPASPTLIQLAASSRARDRRARTRAAARGSRFDCLPRDIFTTLTPRFVVTLGNAYKWHGRGLVVSLIEGRLIVMTRGHAQSRADVAVLRAFVAEVLEHDLSVLDDAIDEGLIVRAPVVEEAVV